METLLSRKTNRQSGFTLLEVVIAISVLTFGLLAVAGLMSQLSLNTGASRVSGMEVLLASERLEDLNARGLSDPNITPGGSLTADGVSQSVTYAGSTVIVPYSDTIDVSTGSDTSSNGDIIETVVGKDSIGNADYTITDHSPAGQASSVLVDPGTPPAATSATMVFHRRWLIEKDLPVVGVYRMTVWVQLEPVVGQLSGAMAVPFQTSMERPYR